MIIDVPTKPFPPNKTLRHSKYTNTYTNEWKKCKIVVSSLRQIIKPGYGLAPRSHTFSSATTGSTHIGGPVSLFASSFFFSVYIFLLQYSLWLFSVDYILWLSLILTKQKKLLFIFIYLLSRFLLHFYAL